MNLQSETAFTLIMPSNTTDTTFPLFRGNDLGVLNWRCVGDISFTRFRHGENTLLLLLRFLKTDYKYNHKKCISTPDGQILVIFLIEFNGKVHKQKSVTFVHHDSLYYMCYQC
jgi:hypothetical protein